MRDVHPSAVPFGIDPLEPDGGVRGVRGRGLFHLVAAVGERDVAMQFDSNGTEIAGEVRPFGYCGQPGFLRVHADRLTAGRPTVAVCETEIVGKDRCEVLHVAAHHGRFHLALEGENLSDGCGFGSGWLRLRERRSGRRTRASRFGLLGSGKGSDGGEDQEREHQPSSHRNPPDESTDVRAARHCLYTRTVSRAELFCPGTRTKNLEPGHLKQETEPGRRTKAPTQRARTQTEGHG